MNERWLEHVDRVMVELYPGSENNLGLVSTYREIGLAEYAHGLDPEEFRRLLIGLKMGDVVTFFPKDQTFWPVLFMPLFSHNDGCFQYASGQLPSEEMFWQMAMKGTLGRTDAHPIKCNIVRDFVGGEHNIDWMTRYLVIFLKDFAVEKAEPE